MYMQFDMYMQLCIFINVFFMSNMKSMKSMKHKMKKNVFISCLISPSNVFLVKIAYITNDNKPLHI